MARKRTKLEITKDILEILKRGDCVRITHLIYRSNLSNNSIKPYLNNLLKNGLITKVIKGGKTFFDICDRGRKFLEDYGKIKIFSDAYGI